MNQLALETLSLYLEMHPEILSGASRIIFPRARYHRFLETLKDRELCLTQTFKPAAEIIEANGLKLSAEITPGADLAIIFPTSQKQESLSLIAQSFLNLKSDGICLVACEKNRGADSYRKYLKELGGTVESWSKNHCVIASCRRDSATFNEAAARELTESTKMQQVPSLGYTSAPGIFGWEKIDEGSKLLIEYLPQELFGPGADFGCGYGYLSVELSKRVRGVKEICLIDAESLSLGAAKQNLKQLAPQIAPEFVWADLTRWNRPSGFDWIVMNPPCHVDGKQDFEIGRAFIKNAAASLRPGGRLFMVAQETLPYERDLESSFPSYTSEARKNGFKVLFATKAL